MEQLGPAPPGTRKVWPHPGRIGPTTDRTRGHDPYWSDCCRNSLRRDRDRDRDRERERERGRKNTTVAEAAAAPTDDVTVRCSQVNEVCQVSGNVGERPHFFFPLLQQRRRSTISAAAAAAAAVGA